MVEIDGDVHKTPHQYEYDINRDWELKEIGVKVIRFRNKRINMEVKAVVEEIKEYLPNKD